MVTKPSAGRRGRLAGTALIAVAALTAAGCGSNSSTPGVSALSSAASKASEAASSAIAKVKGGVDAAGDVSAGAVTIGSDGKAVTRLKVSNPTSEVHDYTVAVSFHDAGGSLVDAAVLTVSQVPANGSKDATAKSNRDLSGTITVKVTAAVRH
ncbi:MAG: hypothetical protein HOV87_13885 [Catenulispora sp.]|nr:hypothetical protein [Catenulispora sp.]